MYVVVFLVDLRTIPLESAQVAVSFFPPIALQLACGSFLNSHTGISRSSICGIMVSLHRFYQRSCFDYLTELLSLL